MIKDIQELNFPSYATMSAATVSLPDMGEWNITSQIKIDGHIAPDFSYDWEVVHDGHKYIMPLRKPQGGKDNELISSVIDLTFQHWAIWQLKRWPFVTMQPIDSGTAVADEEVATVSLNLGDFCKLFAQVLNYYYGDKITIQLNPDWQYKAEAEVITISHTKVWNVLIEVFHKQFGVRWAIEPNGGYDKYVIKVGYPTTEQSHIFEYGFEGGLMKVERQVQSEEICNLLKGRGGEKNLPYRYFKNVDPQNDTFKADPDWIEELANIYFSNLMPATFRSYVQGWKAAHISKYPGYTAVGEANAYAPWAYRKGFTDTKFHPVEFVADEITVNPETGDNQVEILPGYSPFVKKGSSLDKYGPLMNSLDNNEDIYPTIQGVTVDPYGRIDEVIEVKPITSDDIEEAAENDAKISTFKKPWPSKTEKVKKNSRTVIKLEGEWFTVPTGKYANFDEGRKVVQLTKTVKDKTYKTYWDYKTEGWVTTVTETEKEEDVNTEGIVVSETKVTIINESGETISASGIPEGMYRYVVECAIENTTNEELNVTLALEEPTLTNATLSDKWSSVWRIWVKNIWQTSKQSGETDAQYAKRVWEPILGDRAGNEAKVVFASGMLAHEDYEFVITSIPKYERKKCTWQTVENGEIVEHEYWSEWCIELGKSEAELDTLGVYLPSVMRQAIAGDFFFFIGIDMPHLYVKWGEERVDNWKKDNLQEKKDIKPTWVVQTDRVRLNNEGKPDALIRQLHPGDTLRLADKRFIEGDYETLYLSSLTITYREPTSDDAALNPDVEIVLSDRYEVSANPVATLQGEVSALAKQVGSISNVEQIMRAIGDKLYLRKDGLPDRSMSPTEFASLLTSLGFRSGMVGGAGWGIYKDANGNWVIEADRFMARQDFEVNNLVINQVVGQGGTIVESAARMEIIRVEDTANGYKCYFDQHEGTVANLFHVDDVAWCNRFTPENTDLKFYRRRVTEVGVDYVLLSKTDVNGSGIPAEGDVIVQRGNYTDAQRQYVKVRDVIGGGYECYLEALDSVNAEGVQYYSIGRQAGLHNNRPYFYLGDDNGFIEWVNGVLNIKGKLNLLSTYDGKNLGDYIGDAAESAANAAKAELQGKIDALQDQVDGVMEAWSYPYTPTTSNYPADQWATEGEKNAHVGDVFYNIQPAYNEDGTANPDAGKAWRWSQGDNEHSGWHWHPIADSDAVRALQLAQMSVLDSDVLFKQGESLTDFPVPLPAVNTSGTITNYNGWSTDSPTWEAGKYIWQTTYVKKGDGSATFSAPTCISGRNGKGIDRIEEEYYLSTSRTQILGGSWSTTRQPWVAGHFYWTRSHVYYTDSTDETIGEVCVTGESGAAAPNLVSRYSADAVSWHPIYSVGDIWMQTSNDGGVTWGGAMRFQGAGYSPNLILGGNVKHAATANSYSIYSYPLDDDTEWKVGDKLTISACICVGDDDDSIAIEIGRADMNYKLIPTQKNVEEIKTLEVTLTAVSANYKKRFFVYAYPYTQPPFSPNTYVKWIVVQRGHDAGTNEWLPAASEMVGQDGKWRKPQWAKNNSETLAPTSGWQDTPLTSTPGEYVWIRYGWVTPPATEPTTYEPAVRLTGDKGQSGDSVYMLDLSNEMMPIPCDAAGNVVGTYSTSQATVYKGGTKVTSDITYTIAQQAGVSATITSAGLVTPSALTADRGTIVVQAVVAGITLQTTLSLYKVKPGANGDNYSNNLLLNSAFESGLKNWYGSGTVVDSTKTRDGRPSAKIIVDNRTSNGYIGIQQGRPTAGPNPSLIIDDSVNAITASVWVYSDNISSIDYGAVMEIDCFDANDVRQTVIAYDIKPTKNNEWQKKVYTRVIPSGTVLVRAWMYVARNGRLWLNSPKYEVGDNKDPQWSPNASEMVGADGAAAVVYSIEPSVDNITKSMTGELSATSVTCSVYKTTGNSTRVLTSEKTLTCYKVKSDGTTQTTILTHTNGVSSAQSVADDTEALIFELTEGTTVLDHERVPVLTDASDLEIGGNNLLLKSDVVASNSNYLVKEYDLASAPEVGETYTFTLWGQLAPTKQAFWIYNSGDSVQLAGLKDIGDGKYQAVFQWKNKLNNNTSNDTTLRVYAFQLAQTGTSTIRKAKLEKGNVGTDWSPSPKDAESKIEEFDYLKEALKENGSMEGGLILGSLMQLGYTPENDEYKVTAGVNGIVNNNDNGGGVAIWAGGPHADAATTGGGATMAFRHDGTGYAANNVIRFEKDHVAIGDNDVLKLFADGLYMYDSSGYAKMRIVNTPIEGDISTVGFRSRIPIPYSSIEFKKSSNINLLLSKGMPKVYPIMGGNAPSDGYIDEGTITMVIDGTNSWPELNGDYPMMEVGIRKSGEESYLSYKRVGFSPVGQAMMAQLNLSKSNRLDFSAIDNLELVVKIFNYDDPAFMENNAPTLSGSLSGVNVTASYTGTSEMTTIGTNGQSAEFGLTAYKLYEGYFGVRIGEMVFEMSAANGIRVSKNGGAGWKDLI